MLLHDATQTVALKVPDPLAIRELLPKSKLIQHPDYNIQIKHTLESTRVLRNIGYDVPGPIYNTYGWPGKYKPFVHQKVMADFMTMHKRCFNLGEMGIGKSAATLWAADWLMENKRVKKVAIISPLSTIERVWAQDIYDVLLHRTCAVVHGPKEKRLAAMKADVDFYIINHDGITISWLNDMIATRPDIDLIVIDEASMFRNAGTKKYKALTRMLRPDVRVWLLTGTPCPNAPTDAWALAKLVSPEKVPKFFGQFQRQTMMKVSQYKWEARKDAYVTAYNCLQPAVRFKKSECLDLPSITYQDRQCVLTPEQTKAFAAMKQQMVMEDKGGNISAVNAADKINKLRQILCGSIKHPRHGTYMTLPHGPRLTELVECIEQASAKVIVVVPFKGILRELGKELEKAKYSVGILNGDVSLGMRNKIIKQFKTQQHPHILACHPKVMSHGLNLTEADTLIFYAPIYSNDEFQQVVERFNRAGQKRKMTVVRMAAHPLEWQIYKLVDQRKTGQDSILRLYKTIVE